MLSLDNVSWLKKLGFYNSGETSLPSLDGLTELQTLRLNGCSCLTSLPSLDGLTALQTLDLEGCSALTSLPSLDELRAKLLGTIQAPASKLVRTLVEPGSSLARVVRAKFAEE